MTPSAPWWLMLKASPAQFLPQHYNIHPHPRLYLMKRSPGDVDDLVRPLHEDDNNMASPFAVRQPDVERGESEAGQISPDPWSKEEGDWANEHQNTPFTDETNYEDEHTGLGNYEEKPHFVYRQGGVQYEDGNENLEETPSFVYGYEGMKNKDDINNFATHEDKPIFVYDQENSEEVGQNTDFAKDEEKPSFVFTKNGVQFTNEGTNQAKDLDDEISNLSTPSPAVQSRDTPAVQSRDTPAVQSRDIQETLQMPVRRSHGVQRWLKLGK
eukprot:TRINITY_DN25732_c0_g1_i1.p1 TRINITY_DN25732_c0_g1~~TRINITY_DN25732_c0_g1_i1.p1  ORF type:complete len:284 (-),score=55.35 TRINITY_DN25732_c0_g1_i1:24-830(-)